MPDEDLAKARAEGAVPCVAIPRRARGPASCWRARSVQELTLPGIASPGAATRPTPVLHVHPTSYCYCGDADPQKPGGMAVIYRDLVADDVRTRQIAADVAAALARGRHCLVLTLWIAHLNSLAETLRTTGYEPIVLRGGLGAKSRSAALASSRSLAARRCW